MKTVQISAVRRISTDDANLVILELANGKPAIVRTPEQFLNDINGSFITSRELRSVNDPQFRRVLRDLKGGTVTADLKHVKAGESWQVTENSQVITNPKAKGYGKYSIGDMKEYEKDATIVQEGFLTLELKEDAYQREENAQAYANARVGSADAFAIPVVEVIDAPIFEDNGGNDEDELPTKGAIASEVVTEAAGA